MQKTGVLFITIPLARCRYLHTSHFILLLCTVLFFNDKVLSQSWRDMYPPTANHGPSPYMTIPNWMEPFPEDGYVWGSNPGVFVESLDRIFVIQRGELHVPDPLPEGFTDFYGSTGLSALRPQDGGRVMRNVIFIVNAEGKLQETWNQWDYLFEGTGGPHKIAISPFDPQRKVWVVNDARHQIHAFTNDGSELVMSLGTWDESGEDETHLGRPQEIAFLSDGTMVVADGIDNARVVKYDSQGGFIKAWGSLGDADGQFNVVHSVAVDEDDNIYVADRNNDRIQVFSKDGDHLASWGGFNFPNHILITDNQDVWVADNQPVRVIKLDRDGNRLYSWDAHGHGEGEFGELHEFGIDAEGSWYGADNVLGRTQKFVPGPGANPAHLMQEPVALAD